MPTEADDSARSSHEEAQGTRAVQGVTQHRSDTGRSFLHWLRPGPTNHVLIWDAEDTSAICSPRWCRTRISGAPSSRQSLGGA